MGLTGSGRWLIPAALGFLALSVLFALVMLAYPFGDAGVPVSAPASAGPSPAAAPSPSPSPSPTPSPSPSPSPAPGAVGDRLRTAGGRCLDAAPGDPEGAAAQPDPCGDGAGQRWRQVPGDGAVTLVNVASGKCLDVNNRSTDDGAQVQEWTCNGGPNQQWRLQPAPTAGAVLLVSVNSGKCVDASGGTAVQQPCDGRDSQQWVLGG